MDRQLNYEMIINIIQQSVPTKHFDWTRSIPFSADIQCNSSGTIRFMYHSTSQEFSSLVQSKRLHRWQINGLTNK